MPRTRSVGIIGKRLLLLIATLKGLHSSNSGVLVMRAFIPRQTLTTKWLDPDESMVHLTKPEPTCDLEPSHPPST